MDVPVAFTLKMLELPGQTVTLCGPALTAGARFTVKVAAFELTVLQTPFTIQRY